jgi:hypothetical protein
LQFRFALPTFTAFINLKAFFMKKLYALAVFVVLFRIAHAQVKSGDIILGGNLSYSTQSTSTPQIAGTASPTTFSKQNSLVINPSIGKAIRDNLVLGLDLSYGHNSNSDNLAGSPAETGTVNSFTAGVFVRRYKPLGNGFYLFGQAELSGGCSHSSSSTPQPGEPSTAQNGYEITLQLYPGIAYALNRRWQIETGLPNFLSIDYTHSKSTTSYPNGIPDQSSTYHSFDLASALTGTNEFTVGVRYFIGGK